MPNPGAINIRNETTWGQRRVSRFGDHRVQGLMTRNGEIGRAFFTSQEWEEVQEFNFMTRRHYYLYREFGIIPDSVASSVQEVAGDQQTVRGFKRVVRDPSEAIKIENLEPWLTAGERNASGSRRVEVRAARGRNLDDLLRLERMQAREGQGVFFLNSIHSFSKKNEGSENSGPRARTPQSLEAEAVQRPGGPRQIVEETRNRNQVSDNPSITSNLSTDNRLEPGNLNNLGVSLNTQDRAPFFSYFRPFSMTFIFNQNVALSPGLPVQKRFSNLKSFFGAVFFYESPRPELVSNLTKLEAKILCQIIGRRKYHNETALVSILNKEAQADVLPFRKMEQSKKKEYYVKFCFRAIIKCLKEDLQEFVVSRFQLKPEELLPQNIEHLMYLFYFGLHQFDTPFESLLRSYLDEPGSRQRKLSALRKFYFPDMKNQKKGNKRRKEKGSRTFNRLFFEKIWVSKALICQINIYLFEMLAVISGLQNGDHGVFLRDCEKSQASRGKRGIYSIVEKCNRELTKMLTEWENHYRKGKTQSRVYIRSKKKSRRLSKPVCFREEPEVQTDLDLNSEDLEMLNILNPKINKLNFKFPWSSHETLTAIVETIFAVNSGRHVFNIEGKQLFLYIPCFN